MLVEDVRSSLSVAAYPHRLFSMCASQMIIIIIIIPFFKLVFETGFLNVTSPGCPGLGWL